ncbi:substrate-binding domain-containing protein [Desertibaculum subflavum]|uniref:substrate-binding domain-containing protein n=1 Tax=Desertibaculum subflavum TaxID=2268458 RepID=UPI000E66FDDD
MLKKTLLLAALASVAFAGTAMARDQIRIVGSSTVFPFTTATAEQFGKGGKFKTPIVESTGTGGGFKLFCGGVGVGHPDMTGASRAMTKGEFESCKKAGVDGITEVKIGYDGIVFANSKANKPSQLTKEQLFLALAHKVPKDGKLVDNPYTTWNQIDPKLANKKIEILGPPPTSGTRDAFIELVMEEACKSFKEIEALKADKKAHKAACSAFREDGIFIEAGENDNLIVQKLVANPAAYGIFGFSFLDQNTDKVQGAEINGVAPTFDNIASGKYSVSRPLFVYAKNQHASVVPGMKEFLGELTSTKAAGNDGYLSSKGLIPLPAADLKKVRDASLALTPLSM